MNIGDKLLELRKKKHLSQEEVADILSVTRQTVSKWETNQSTPDFDKIEPICELYQITPNELILKLEKEENRIEPSESIDVVKRAKGIGMGVVFYFLAVIWIMIAIPVMQMNPIVASAVFLGICALATFLVIYTCMTTKRKVKKEKETIQKKIESLLAVFFTIIYLLISFMTMQWQITWILWIVYALVCKIIDLIIVLGGMSNEK